MSLEDATIGHMSILRIPTDGGETAARFTAIFAGPSECRTPEDWLRLSVLRDAIFTFVKLRDRKSKFGRLIQAREDLIEWFQDSDDDYVFSFASICERFGMNATAIRERIFTMPRDELRAITKASGRQLGRNRAAKTSAAELVGEV